MNVSKEVLRLFPPAVEKALRQQADDDTEEIRCRVGNPYVICTASGERPVCPCRVSPSDLDYILERASNYSMHACQTQLRAGFLHTGGGCRIGVCGTVTENGLRSVSSLSVRIPHAVTGCAQPLIPLLMKEGLQSTWIVSPPGAGKTTLLRDLIRALSEQGYRVSVADERGELAAVHGRRPQFDLGPRTDVMTGGSKHKSAFMLLRAMNPQILAFDEITAPEDIEAARYAAGCGVILLATAHAADARSLQERPLYRELLREKIFRQAVEIQIERGKRKYQVVKL